MTESGSIPAGSAGVGPAPAGGHLGVHLLVGLAWLYALFLLVSALGEVAASVWLTSAILLWFVGAAELRTPDARSPARHVTTRWWLQTWVAPLFAGVALLRLLGLLAPAAGRGGGAAAAAAAPPAEIEPRLAELGRALASLRPQLSALQARVAELERELGELRGLSAPETREQRAPAPSAEAPEPRSPVAPSRQPEPEPAQQPQPRPRREVDLAELLGARALAWAGGLVTLLGVVFFFVLAVDRGWIGPVERVGLGALASAALLAAGVLGRRRYGNLYSTLAAAGAGVAGAYATLLAAAALYGLVGDLTALLLAAAIATAGAAIALAWRSETLAAIGLVGATAVPFSLVFEGGLSVIGTGFVAIVFAATAAVAIRRDWRLLLAAGTAVSAAQIALLVVETGTKESGSVLVLAAVFVALYLASGIVLEQRGAHALERLATTLVLGSASLAVLASVALIEGTMGAVDRRGAALLGTAAAYGLCAAFVLRRPRGRDLSALLGAVALALTALGLADILSGTSLAIAWAAQAAVLAWLGARIEEPRYRLASLVYLTLALAYALAVPAAPVHLFTSVAAPAAGVASVVAIALAALVFVRYGRGWEPLRGSGAVTRALARAASLHAAWTTLAVWLAPALGVYALSLVVLEAARALELEPSFAWGHVALTGAWAAGGGAVLLAGAAVGRRPLQLAGLAWLAAALLKVTLFELYALPAPQAAWSALALGTGYAAAAYGVGLLRRPVARDLALVLYGGIATSGALVFGAITELVGRGEAVDPRGATLLAAAGCYAALGATLFRRAARRDAVGAFWTVALVLAFTSSLLLLESPTVIVAAWSAGAAMLGLLAAALDERRLLLGSAALVVAALGRTLIELAPPADLFVPAEGAANGVPALAVAIGALLILVWASRRLFSAPADTLDGAVDRVRAGWLVHTLIAIAVLAIYGLSLSVLGAAQLLGGGDVTTDFQRGHTAVSAFWGLIGLAALRLGLTRRRPALKLAGFVLFGVSLAKLFLYDLTMLSSITRALSFLAVGAVLLLAGFFYQRLSARTEAA